MRVFVDLVLLGIALVAAPNLGVCCLREACCRGRYTALLPGALLLAAAFAALVSAPRQYLGAECLFVVLGMLLVVHMLRKPVD